MSDRYLTMAKTFFGDRIEYMDDYYDCLDGADALVICTEWPTYRRPDFAEMAKRMDGKLIFDGRNLYDPERVAQRGFTYYAIGRGEALPV